MNTSDHFDGWKFHNLRNVQTSSFSQVPRMMTERGTPWPAQVPVTPRRPAPLGAATAIVTFIGHATFLIQTKAGNILTDPIYSNIAGPLNLAGPRRSRAPGVRFEDLPPISTILLSHNHYDHCDVRTLRMLRKRFNPIVLTPLGNRRVVAKAGLNKLEELDWWDGATTAAWPVILTPAQHFSARTPFDRNRTLWGSFMLEGEWPRVFFAADTGYWRHFTEVRAQFPAIDLALLPIGAYEPRWFMRPAHMDPGDAVQAHLDLQARLSVAMHFGTFRLTDEAWDDPPRRLVEALDTRSVPRDDFRVLRPGETMIVRAA